MLAQLKQHAAAPNSKALRSHSHLLFILPLAKELSRTWPAGDVLASLLARRQLKAGELAKSAVTGNLVGGALASWVMLDPRKPAFEKFTALRSALQPLLAENPAEIAIVVVGDRAQREHAASLAMYCSWVNGAVLPERKKKPAHKPLKTLHLYGYRDAGELAAWRARAEGNVLCRELTVLPPNELTPTAYRARIKQLAKEHGWRREEYDYRQLKKMGAGAFCAVAQGSDLHDAAIVHLRYAHPRATRTVALVGKGICFDTGGHNLKPSRYMYAMHEDMNGSAVALGTLLAVTRMKSPLNIDCWLAISRNDVSARAYHQSEVVRALNGTTIEVMHTDAEGRMVLADTLTLAARGKPAIMIDFATLTGTMHAALSDRYSGIFATSDDLAARAVAAGRAAGERVCVFPQDEDYDSALDSKIADIKQCTLDGEADHILATRFLSRFTAGTPWIHVDLSASSSKGGLGAVVSDTTGFGVGWALELLAQPHR